MQLNYIANAGVPSSSGRPLPLIHPPDRQPFHVIQPGSAPAILAAVAAQIGSSGVKIPTL